MSKLADDLTAAIKGLSRVGDEEFFIVATDAELAELLIPVFLAKLCEAMPARRVFAIIEREIADHDLPTRAPSPMRRSDGSR